MSLSIAWLPTIIDRCPLPMHHWRRHALHQVYNLLAIAHCIGIAHVQLQCKLKSSTLLKVAEAYGKYALNHTHALVTTCAFSYFLPSGSIRDKLKIHISSAGQICLVAYLSTIFYEFNITNNNTTIPLKFKFKGKMEQFVFVYTRLVHSSVKPITPYKDWSKKLSIQYIFLHG